MNHSKHKLTGLLLATAIGASSISHAEGLLGGLFSSRKDADFKTMLSHVPADTSYLLANKKPMPDDVIQFQLQRARQVMNMIPPDAIKPGGKTDDKTGDKADNTDKAGQFFEALFKDLGDKLDDKKFTETGLSTNSSNVFYGYQTLPVARIGITDKDALMATLKRAEEKSGYKLDLQKCGEQDCFASKDEESGMNFIVVLMKNHLALSVFPDDKQEIMLKHLTGKSSPEKSYAEKDWDAFLETNKFSGYGDGYINLKKLFEKNSSLILEGMKLNSAGKSTKKADPKSAAGCLAVAAEHIENVPEVLFGTTGLTKETMDYQLVVKTSPTVSKAIQGIANNASISKRSPDPIIDFGLNINFANLGKALTQYSNFLTGSAEKNKCKDISPMDVRKAMGGAMMVLNMGLSQFKSLYFTLNKLDLDDKLNPQNVEALVSIGADNPGSLVAMLAMTNPAFASLKIPKDGSPVKLPENLIPGRGAPLPPIFLSQKDKTLNIMIGNDKPTLTDYKPGKPEMMILGMDGKRYYSKMASIMKALPPVMPGKSASLTNKADKSAKQQINEIKAQQVQAYQMMKTMAELSGKLQEEIYADERGLVVDYHIKY